MGQFSTIAIVGRPDHEGVVETIGKLLQFLDSRSLDVVIDDVTAELIGESSVPVFPRTEISGHCDLVIVVGGDGSMLSMAKFIVSEEIPVIGVNRGRLGFLTDVLPNELEEQIAQVLDGDYTVEKRFLLDVQLRRDDEIRAVGSALNDVVLHPGQAAQMIEFELFVDERFVYSQESDGLIVATPTGSTAYALSAGGPIMHPDLNAVVLVPMYPHSLSSRPIVIDGDSEIRLIVSAKESLQPQLSCDGEVKHSVSAGDELLVKKTPTPLKLIHPPNYSYYQACRSKLGWGSRLVRLDD
ncbi:MAG: NAD(+) kinase [Pseudomonadales bacterium]|nr:NAD(+) kinase [Pseudomonadales bacterium]